MAKHSWPKVEKGVPIPSPKWDDSMKSFIESLSVGDSFVDLFARRDMYRAYAKLRGFTIVSRRIEAEEGEERQARYWLNEKK